MKVRPTQLETVLVNLINALDVNSAGMICKRKDEAEALLQQCEIYGIESTDKNQEVLLQFLFNELGPDESILIEDTQITLTTSMGVHSFDAQSIVRNKRNNKSIPDSNQCLKAYSTLQKALTWMREIEEDCKKKVQAAVDRELGGSNDDIQ